MKRITLTAPTGKCEILVGERLANVSRHMDAEKAVIVTDRNVRRIHGGAFPPYDVIEIGTGERCKTRTTVDRLYKRFLELGLERSSFVLGIGGGVVCDVAGYAATDYLRGVDFGFVPTTLLAQVDAAIGGKNGVNFMGYKNLVGAIRQPRFCICDPAMLETLPPQERRNGFSEVIKYAAIADASLLQFLEASVEKALRLDDAVMDRIIHACIAVKVALVEKDEREKGDRTTLNFGHTIGHALEKTTRLRHGEAVAVGMMAATRLSVAKGMLENVDAEWLRNVIKAFGLPTECRMDREAMVDAIGKDKKRHGGSIRMVLLEGIGNARITELDIDEIAMALGDMR